MQRLKRLKDGSIDANENMKTGETHRNNGDEICELIN